MTITFQGHVKSIYMSNAPLGKLSVTVQTPIAEGGGKEWIIFVPEKEGKYWIPGTPVSFTIYAIQPVPKVSE